MNNLSIRKMQLPPAKTLLALAISSILFTLPVIAQEPATQVKDEADNKDKTSGKVAGLEVITVTSQKRTQNVMKVPIAVDTFTSEDIKDTGALNLQEIHEYMPGFDMNEDSVTQPNISIRGITSSQISSGGDPSVATFYDGVYLPSAATTISFSDLQRVEVLMGPQGTLFGRNSAAGAISMVPNQPEQDMEGFVSLKAGNYGLKRVEGMLNLPLSEDVSLRFNAMTNMHDGWATNVSGGKNPGEKDNTTVRAALKWDISDKTNLSLSYDWDKLVNGPTHSYGLSQYALNQDPFSGEVANDVIDGKESRDMYAITAKLDHKFSDAWSMKYTASYRDFQTYNREDLDGTADVRRYADSNNELDTDIFYNELQFSYVRNGVTWILGANYSKENTMQLTTFTATADSIATLVTGSLLSELANQGIPKELLASVEHIWNPADFGLMLSAVNLGQFASGQAPVFPGSGDLSAFGYPNPPYPSTGYGVLNGDVGATGDAYYEGLSMGFGVAEIFGPSYAGNLWQETIANTGSFTNYGIFSDVTFQLMEKLEWTLGLRYSYDNKDFSWDIPTTDFTQLRSGVSNQIFTDTTEGVLNANQSWSKSTGRSVLNYFLNDEMITYLSYSTGYKSGGFDALNPGTAFKSIRPELATSIELGIKGDFFGSRLRGQFSYFDMELVDRQKSVNSAASSNGISIPTIINGTQDTTGFELKMQWVALESLRLGLATTVREVDSIWDEFSDANGNLRPSTKIKSKTKQNYTLRLNWTPEVSSGLLRVNIDYIFKENTSELDPDFIAAYTNIPGYGENQTYLNARISWENDEDTIEVALWGKNLLDNDYIYKIRSDTANTFGTPFASIRAPLTFGIDAKYKF
tara:strand:- start:62225 stop:64810 length:2586 start_codon:yes stop_codon:yes gene_type:complete